MDLKSSCELQDRFFSFCKKCHLDLDRNYVEPVDDIHCFLNYLFFNEMFAEYEQYTRNIFMFITYFGRIILRAAQYSIHGYILIY